MGRVRDKSVCKQGNGFKEETLIFVFIKIKHILLPFFFLDIMTSYPWKG